MIAQTYCPRPSYLQTPESRKSLETGFPSSVADHLEDRLNLHNHLVKKPASTFFSRVRGDESKRLGIYDGDLLVIDRSLAPRHQSLVIIIVEGESRVCRLLNESNQWVFLTGNGKRIRMNFEENSDTEIWGSITHVIHSCS